MWPLWYAVWWFHCGLCFIGWWTFLRAHLCKSLVTACISWSCIFTHGQQCTSLFSRTLVFLLEKLCSVSGYDRLCLWPLCHCNRQLWPASIRCGWPSALEPVTSCYTSHQHHRPNTSDFQTSTEDASVSVSGPSGRLVADDSSSIAKTNVNILLCL